jgi:hypothetical protein
MKLHFTPRDEAKRQAFKLINAKQEEVDFLIDLIIEAAKDEIREEISENRSDEIDPDYH